MKNRDERTSIGRRRENNSYQQLVLREVFFNAEVATLFYTADPCDLGHDGPAN